VAGVDVVVVAGTWALGSVVVSLAVGAVVARAERLGGRSGPGVHGGQRRREPRTALAAGPASVLPLALPAPRTSLEQVAPSAS
jgi:hypothetical protein